MLLTSKAAPLDPLFKAFYSLVTVTVTVRRIVLSHVMFPSLKFSPGRDSLTMTCQYHVLGAQRARNQNMAVLYGVPRTLAEL